MRPIAGKAIFAFTFTLPFALSILSPSTAHAQPLPPDPYYATPGPPVPAGASAQSIAAQSAAPSYFPNPQPPRRTTLTDDGVGYDDAAEEAAEDAAAEQLTDEEGVDPDAYADFQVSLSPYGQWVDNPEYGEVWEPSSAIVGDDFSPYGSGGHWALSEYGWTWISDFDWGWAPFHYGRWAMIHNAWAWLPGRVWGPAWCSWRWGGGYVGWAPLGPHGTVAQIPRASAPSPWRFTSSSGLMAIRPRYETGAAVQKIFLATSTIRNTQLIDRHQVEAGPIPHLIASAVGRPIQATAVHSFAVAAPRATIVPRPSSAASRGFANYRSPSTTTITGRAPGGSFAQRSSSPAPYLHPLPTSTSYSYRTPYAPQLSAYRSYAAPAERAPAYSAPIRAPAYSAPSYSAPSYSEPSYAAPVSHPAAAAPAVRPSYSAPHATGSRGGRR